jgi:hypothetical protein
MLPSLLFPQSPVKDALSWENREAELDLKSGTALLYYLNGRKGIQPGEIFS